MKRIVNTLMACIFTAGLAYSQDVQLTPSVIASAGGYSEAGEISLSWTLGELSVSTLKNGDYILTQGFQQVYLNDVGLSKDPIKWQIAGYPNPVEQNLNIQFDLLKPSGFTIEIQDVSGRIMYNEKHDNINPGDILNFDMTDYRSGIYFFKVRSQDGRQVRVLNIRKS